VTARFKALGFDKVWKRAGNVSALGCGAGEHAPNPHAVSRSRWPWLALGNSSRHAEGRAVRGRRGDAQGLQGAGRRPYAASVKGKDRLHQLTACMPSADGHDYGPAHRQAAVPDRAVAAKLGGARLRAALGWQRQRPAARHTGVTACFADKGAPASCPAGGDLQSGTADPARAHARQRAKQVSLQLDLDCGIDGQYTGANVIGQVNGRRAPGRGGSTIGGHLDSWDPGQPARLTTAPAWRSPRLPRI